MTQDEVQKLKDDLKADIIRELTGKDYKAANSTTGEFSKVRDKYMQKLHEAYGHVWYAQVWDNIRRLSCFMAGVRYIRDLCPSKELIAADIAEKLCIMAIEAREAKAIE